ncbi:MAG: DNA-binding transcriptional ArsR family regulator [Yoonia sp.]|jgi:DNA-binding transcriptional ArsR family regulator
MLQPTFRALADPTRRDILMLLRSGDMTIAQVAENFDMTRAAVKKHLTILVEAGLITTRAQGRERYNSLIPQGLTPIRDWISDLDAFWDYKLTDLKHAIEKDTK